MDSVQTLTALFQSVPYGKRLPQAVYLHDPEVDSLWKSAAAKSTFPPELLRLMRSLRDRFCVGESFNILKFHLSSPRISFLAYPDFFNAPHPCLKAAVLIDLVTGKVRRTDYSGRENPPILHRKETFLTPGHPKLALFSKLTREEEREGLLDETASIGFRLNWEKRLAERGFQIRGHQLVRIDEVKSFNNQKNIIPRHKTAIVRKEFSKPVKLLIEMGLLTRQKNFFDFGCGYGTDHSGLGKMGYSASGWDPYYYPDAPLLKADIVNLGFILNVIEDPAERVQTIQEAWQLATEVLIVTTLIAGQETYADAKPFQDGYLTSLGTFQKYYQQQELQVFIEDALQTDAVPIGLGVYAVFRSLAQQHDFLSSRSRRFIDWEGVSRRLGLRQIARAKKDPFERNPELMEAFAKALFELGRTPFGDEFSNSEGVRKLCGSFPKAKECVLGRYGLEAFNDARASRKEDLLVYFSSSLLGKRVPFSRLSPSLQRDIKSYFGKYEEAEAQARHLLFASGDPQVLLEAISELDCGWFDREEMQFTFHSSNYAQLPAVLRVYIACAAHLFGDPKEADLIKIHPFSRKLTFQTYEDFESDPIPRLKLRIKVDLRRLFVTVFNHAEGPDRQLLYFKDRFLPKDHPSLARAREFSRRLRKIGFSEATIGYGPPEAAFLELARQHGLTRSLYPRSTQ